MVALQPLGDGELECLSVLVLSNDPGRAAALTNTTAIGRVDAIAMRLRMLGKELSRMWQFRRMFQEMIVSVVG